MKRRDLLRKKEKQRLAFASVLIAFFFFFLIFFLFKDGGSSITGFSVSELNSVEQEYFSVQQEPLDGCNQTCINYNGVFDNTTFIGEYSDDGKCFCRVVRNGKITQEVYE